MIVKKHILTTVGELKKFLKNIPDDTEISIDDVGTSGFVETVELELQKFADGDVILYLNIGAESGSL